jgi:hypothetical protein
MTATRKERRGISPKLPPYQRTAAPSLHPLRSRWRSWVGDLTRLLLSFFSFLQACEGTTCLLFPSERAAKTISAFLVIANDRRPAPSYHLLQSSFSTLSTLPNLTKVADDVGFPLCVWESARKSLPEPSPPTSSSRPSHADPTPSHLVATEPTATHKRPEAPSLPQHILLLHHLNRARPA